eukprot:297691_1
MTNVHDIDEIAIHPLLPENHHASLLHMLIDMDSEDAITRCQQSVTSHQSMITANATHFTNIKNMWTHIGDRWEDIKEWHGYLKKLKITSDKFTLWMPEFLYRNNWVDVFVTNMNELGYKQLKRYSFVEGKAYDLWDLHTINGLVLPCDRLHGPFISNNTQIYQCHTLLNMIRREQSEWDESLTVVQNFQRNPDWMYWYGDILPFYTIWSNAHDRRCYFQSNADARGARNVASRNDNKQKSSKFMTKKEFFFQNKINGLENDLEKAHEEITRKENVIQYMTHNYYSLQHSHQVLQNQYTQALLELQTYRQQMPLGNYYYNPYNNNAFQQ